jgi:hypothetical protein
MNKSLNLFAVRVDCERTYHFGSAGVVQPDEQIPRVMSELLIQAADQTQAT